MRISDWSADVCSSDLSDPEPPWRLEGAWGVEVLRMLARSGRGHWQNEQAPALTVDVAQAGKWRWQLGDDGRSRLQLEVAAAAVVLPLQPPWYVDAAHARVGPVDGGVPAALAQPLLCASAPAPHRGAALADRRPAATGQPAAHGQPH